MEVKAQAKYVRMSPRKIRLVADLIRSLEVEKAEFQLSFMTKAAAEPVLKLLKSAVANALHDFKLKKENLYVKEIRADAGPTLKRWQPRAFGRATPIRKRSAHIAVVLGEKKESRLPLAEKLQEKKEKPQIVQASEFSATRKGVLEKPKEILKEKKEAPKEYKKTKGFFKKLFIRKTG
jgi:large subunit ribosomal protein L22